MPESQRLSAHQAAKPPEAPRQTRGEFGSARFVVEAHIKYHHNRFVINRTAFSHERLHHESKSRYYHTNTNKRLQLRGSPVTASHTAKAASNETGAG